MPDLTAAVLDHAAKNYERGGWDIIIEAYDENEIAEMVGGATTVAGAISNVAKAAGIALHEEMRAPYRVCPKCSEIFMNCFCDCGRIR